MLRPPVSLINQEPHSFSVALAIRKIPADPKQKHVAFLYRNTDQSWWLLHLGWHHQLNHHEWDNNYFWLPFKHLEPEVIEGIVDQAVIIGSRNADAKIPYSVLFQPGQYFDQENNYLRNEVGEGLTCATFILAIFRRWEIPLIADDTWPQGRKDDINWVLQIVRKLHEWGKKIGLNIPRQHLFAQLRQRWELRRYRPEEICACAELFGGEPLSFQAIAPLSISILRQLS